MFINGLLYFEDVSASNLSTYKGGGKVKYIVYPQTISQIRKVIDYCYNSNLPFFILGNGSNTLIRDNGYKGVFICTKLMDKVSISQNSIYCGCGTMIKKLYKMTLSTGLGGLEKLATIPSTIGGLIKGNAGAFGVEIKDLIIDVDLLNKETLAVERKANIECGFDYRSSNLDKYLIVGARLKLHKLDKAVIQNTYNNCIKIRRFTQPKESSIGCVFKNTDSIKAGKLIDSLGLKGLSYGGAMVSNKHANFIVNTGCGTATDYLRVLEKVESRVLSEFGITLQKEIQII